MAQIKSVQERYKIILEQKMQAYAKKLESELLSIGLRKGNISNIKAVKSDNSNIPFRSDYRPDKIPTPANIGQANSMLGGATTAVAFPPSLAGSASIADRFSNIGGKLAGAAKKLGIAAALAGTVGVVGIGGNIAFKSHQAGQISKLQKAAQSELASKKVNEVESAFVKSSADSTADAEVHVLVGSAYKDEKGKESPFGHTALYVKTKDGKENVYDFGRYGKIKSETVGGVTLTGSNSPRGEGILKVWSSLDSYIKNENKHGAGTSLPRVTEGYGYKISNDQAEKIIQHYNKLQKEGKPTGLSTGDWKSYKLSEDYYALGNNCTTVSLDPLDDIMPGFGKNQGVFIDIVDGLPDPTARAAFLGAGYETPKNIVLPHNLNNYLKASPDIKVDLKNTYSSRNN